MLIKSSFNGMCDIYHHLTLLSSLSKITGSAYTRETINGEWVLLLDSDQLSCQHQPIDHCPNSNTPFALVLGPLHFPGSGQRATDCQRESRVQPLSLSAWGHIQTDRAGELQPRLSVKSTVFSFCTLYFPALTPTFLEGLFIITWSYRLKLNWNSNWSVIVLLQKKHKTTKTTNL